MPRHGAMSNEFHIFAKNFNSRFVVKRFGEIHGVEFPSLFAAARHARSCAASGSDCVVIHNEFQKALNRIPFHVGSVEVSDL